MFTKIKLAKIFLNKEAIIKGFLAKAVLVLFFSNALFATNLTLSFSQNATDNLFQTRFAEKDYLSTLGFSLDVPFSPFSFFSEGEYYFLYRNSDISYYTQYLGLDYLYAFNEKTALYMGVKGGGHFYRQSFSDFNYVDGGFMASLKAYLTPESILKLDYTFDYKKYNFSSFDNLSHLVSLNVDRYFQTKTTIKIGATWGYKHFIHPSSTTSSSFMTTSSGANAIATTSSTATTASIASDSLYAIPLASSASLGKGYGGYRLGRRDTYFQSEISEAEQRIQIFSLSGLIAQGLSDRIGLRLSATRQWTLSGQNPFNSIEEYYLVENPTYDLYTWNGYSLSGLLTVEGPAYWQLKLGYTWSHKIFPGIEAMDLTGLKLGFWREDRRTLYEAQLQKDFASVTLILSYAYGKNSSNDYLFEWHSHFISLSLDWKFSWGASR